MTFPPCRLKHSLVSSALFALFALLTLLPSLALANLTTERFWIQNTVNREAFGPIVRQTGYRFQIQSESFVVLDSVPGKIRIATYPAGDPFGPYDLINDRIIVLGSHAYTILNVQKVEVPELPPDLRDLTGLRIKGEPTRQAPPPEPHMVRKSLPLEEWPLRIGGWIEPSRSAKYDWTVGGFSGEKALDLKTSRLGARAEWGNAFLQLNLTTDGEQSGSLTPPMTSLDSLCLGGGSGLGLSAGWLQPFILDKNWDLILGAFAEWSSESYDLTAKTLIRTEKAPEPPASDPANPETPPSPTTISYEYRSISSNLDLSETLLGAVAGIDFHNDYWSLRALLRADLLSNTSTSGSVRVNGQNLSISGKRSYPLLAEFGASCYLIDHLRADLTLHFGTIQAIRIGAMWEF